MVLALDDRPALEVLGEIGRSLPDRPLILTVLAEPDRVGPSQGGRPELVVRGVQGVDSARGGLLISDEVQEGMRMTFAIRDANAAREDLEAVTRELARDIAGALPRFGLYVNCAGRGANLYGSFDVDTRILRSRFAGTPIAGMQSTFEIAPHLGKPTLQLYTGVLGLFTSPS
jgi:small ligand-binding sensory domain FIST